MLGLEQALGLVDQQEYTSDQQWQHHVDHAVQQQGSSQGRGTEFVGKGRQQDRFEYAHAARHMAEHTGGQGQQVHQQERAEGRRFGQQQIQHGSGCGDVQCGDDQLQESQASARQAQGAAPGLDQQVVGVGLFRQAAAIDADAQQGRQQQHGAGNAAEQALR